MEAKYDRIVPTGLVGKKANEVLESVIGQMSDGMWENVNYYNKFWSCVDIDENNNICLQTGWIHYGPCYNGPSGWRFMSDDEVRKFFVTRIKALLTEFRKCVKEEPQEYSLEDVRWLTYHETVSEAELKQICKALLNYGQPVKEKAVREGAPELRLRGTLDAWM